ncbi:hypothetical protein ONZ45_g6944 [Pleurotus djamor]|nr:hypothetical protein ONZ45_g6944 [Pleurotus djamor]
MLKRSINIPHHTKPSTFATFSLPPHYQLDPPRMATIFETVAFFTLENDFISKIGFMNVQDLARHIHRQRRALTVVYGRALASLLANLSFPVMSSIVLLISAGFSGWRYAVEEDKLGHLEAEWKRRGQHPLPACLLLDRVMPIIISTSLGLLRYYVDYGSVVDGLIQYAAYWLVSQSSSE